MAAFFFYVLSQHINSARWCAAAGFSSSQVQDAEFISYTAQSFLTRFTLHFASHPAAGCNSSGCSLCNRKCVSMTTGSLHKVVAAQCSAARKIWHYLTLKAAQFPDLFVKTLKDKTILSSVCHCSHPLPMCLLELFSFSLLAACAALVERCEITATNRLCCMNLRLQVTRLHYDFDSQCTSSFSPRWSTFCSAHSPVFILINSQPSL